MGLMIERAEKMLELFFENPGVSFTIRAISAKTGIPKSTVKSYLDELKQKKLVTRDNRAESSAFFKVKKANYFAERLFLTGLMDHLITVFQPEAIILFGSIRKGDSDKQSDIDILAITHETIEPKLETFEKKLKHDIQIHKVTSLSKLNDTLLNNVLNGIKLYGSYKVK